MVAVTTNDLTQLPTVREVLGIGLQFHDDLGAPVGIGLFYSKFVLSLREPSCTLFSTGFTSKDSDFVGNHENAVKAHAELSD